MILNTACRYTYCIIYVFVITLLITYFLNKDWDNLNIFQKPLFKCLIAIDNYLSIYQNSEESTYLFNIK